MVRAKYAEKLKYVQKIDLSYKLVDIITNFFHIRPVPPTQRKKSTHSHQKHPHPRTKTGQNL